MSQDHSTRERGRRGDIGANPGLTSRYLARTRSQRLARRPQSRLGPGFFLLIASSLMGTAMLILFGAVYTVYAEYTSDLPQLSMLSNRLTFKTTQIMDRKGRLLYEVYDRDGGRRTPIHLGDTSPHVINGTIATEDKDFYSNIGFDPLRIATAAWHNLVEGQIVSGASTITQQLAKNVLLEEDERDEQSYARKLREGILAYQISQAYPKDEILEMYLNEIYYGHLSYGIEAAADTYFGKRSRDLTLAEAAMLVGLPQAPSRYDPFVNPQAAMERQIHVLDRMVAEGYISVEEAEEAKTERLRLSQRQHVGIRAPHFVMYVRELLETRYGANLVYRGGLKVTTTLDLDWNRLAEAAIRERLENLRTQNANNAALVAIDPTTGEILAMVGSKDYYDESIDGQVNVAIAPRQPGSTIKPIVYAAAFSKGWAPSTIVVDSATAFPNAPGQPPYRPLNFDHKFDGPMTVRHALANSKNIPAVKALMYVGIPDFVKIAESLGLRFQNPEVYGLSLGLGAGGASLLQMVGAYSALANYGVSLPPTAILRIEDAEGRVIEEYSPPDGRQLLSPVHSYMVTSILSDNTAREPLQGPTSPLLLSRPAAAKTGSTDSYRDSWLIGYTPNVVTGVWVGNTDNSPMREVLGSMGAGRIWNRFMEDVHVGTPVVDFEPPPGVREYRICKETGRPPTEDCQRELIEVYPTGYSHVTWANIEGLTEVTPVATAVGQTVSEGGTALQPTPTLRPGAPTPTPLPEPTATPPAAASTPEAASAATPTPTQQQQGPIPSNPTMPAAGEPLTDGPTEDAATPPAQLSGA